MRRLRIHVRENWYRDLWLAFITLVLLFTVKGLVHDDHRLTNAVQEIQDGRKTGATITCVITSSILQGSHSFIIASSSVPLPPKLEARLLREGYPGKAAREAGAIKQADAYTAAIQKAVEQAAGKAARGLITVTQKKHKPPPGNIDCAQLRAITRVP